MKLVTTNNLSTICLRSSSSIDKRMLGTYLLRDNFSNAYIKDVIFPFDVSVVIKLK